MGCAVRQKWFVYGLMVPATSFIAYVGMTERPKERFNQHKNDPMSSANHLFNREDGHADPVMVLIQRFHTKQEARLFEAQLIHAGLGCSNKEYRAARMWQYIRELIGDEKGEVMLDQIMTEAKESLDAEFDEDQIRVIGGYQSKTEA